MLNAIVITIFASFLWGIINHIDKFMINEVDSSGSSIRTLIMFSTLVAGLVFTPVWLVLSNFQVSIGIISLRLSFFK